MEKSNSIASLAAAMAKAQAKLPVVKFDARNDFLSYKYATLGQVVSVSVPVMAEHGLSIVQLPVSQDGRVGVTSILMHESGEWLSDTITVVPESKKGLSYNQTVGVALTYLRRYAWASMLGLVSDEDTDGDPMAGASEENGEANKKVTAVLSRTWSIDQMEAVIEASNGGIAEHEDAAQVLDMSTLPESAPVKTVASWMKHYMSSDAADPFLKAASANEAYAKAKKGK